MASDIVSKFHKISAILPISITKYGELDHKRFKILLFSLQKCQAQNWLERIYVITPGSQKKIIEKECRDIDFIQINVLEEDELFSEFQKYNYWGYRKQMLIKLGAIKLIENEFFLTLDSDLICLQKIHLNQLIIDSKALLTYQNKNVHIDWWESSAEILSVSLDVHSPGMSVTPAILSKTICGYVIEEIESKFQQSWISVLMEIERFWTEYSLYFLCAQKRNCLTHYHLDSLDDRNTRLIDDEYTVWFAEDIERITKLNQLSLPSGLFAVLQSSTYIPLETILNHLPNMLQLSYDDEQLLKLRYAISAA
jgi:hypothetical protein